MSHHLTWHRLLQNDNPRPDEAANFYPALLQLAHGSADWLLVALVVVAAVGAVSFLLGLYADHLAAGLLWLADRGTSLLFGLFAAKF
jgi:hypothetical protein